MRTVRVRAHAALSADAAFDRITRVADVWHVPFRGRTISWRQRCEPVPSERRLVFTQTFGDFKSLSGAWRAVPAPDGCDVLFELTYDIGVPIYDRILDPLVERVLSDAARTAISRW